MFNLMRLGFIFKLIWEKTDRKKSLSVHEKEK